MEIYFFVFAAIVIFLIYKAIGTYNMLKPLAERRTEAYHNILASMATRARLTNKLQDIAKTYAEAEITTVVTIAQDSGSGAIVDAYRDSIQAVTQVSAVAQRFPDLKANGLYQDLMHKLDTLEHELQFKRETYNKTVREYNSPLKQFPTILYAPALGLPEAPYWQSDDPDDLAKLKEFKTDDDKVRSLMSSMGQKVSQGASSVGTGVGNIARQGTAAVQAKIGQDRGPTSQTQEPAAIASQVEGHPTATPTAATEPTAIVAAAVETEATTVAPEPGVVSSHTTVAVDESAATPHEPAEKH